MQTKLTSLLTMKIDERKFKQVHGYQEGKDVLDGSSLAKAADYKKTVLKSFTAIDQNQIKDRFRTPGDFYVTRKYDGEYGIIFYEDGQTVTVNRSGRTRRGIPCIEEAGRLIAAAGIRQGIFPAEIYVEAEYKTRVNDLISALAHEEKIGTLRLAVFDILEIDGRPFDRRYYTDVWSRLHGIFGGGTLCHEVDFRIARTSGDIEDLWVQWVDRENSEGLVVHTPFVSYKIKPRHYFDAVVIAYGEGSGVEAGQVRRMLFAFMPGPDRYQIMSRVGSGLTEKLRKGLFRFFSGKDVPNPVIGINPKWNDLIFVRPELVIEVAVEEVVTEMASGEKTNYLLSFDGTGYRLEGIVPGYRTYTPVFIRLREDKSPDEHDAGTGQVERYLSTRGGETDRPAKSELLLRDVLSKGGRKPSRRSFVIWRRGDEYVLLVSSSDERAVQRELFRSGRFYPLFNLYQSEVTTSMPEGYKREQDKLITTDSCIETMQSESAEELEEEYV